MIRYVLMALLCLNGMLLFSTSICAEPRLFSEISVDLPDTWEGEERSAFITGNRDEYMLTLGKKNSDADGYVAQISIYILPNKRGISAKDSALELATKQDETTPPVLDGSFWKFSGYPKSNIVKGLATTRVAATEEWWCFIISQDTETGEAETMIATFRGLTERAKVLLGK